MAATVERRTKRAPAKVNENYHSYPFYMPRFWHGMPLGAWVRLLAENRFKISPRHIPTACSITFFSTFNSMLGSVENAVYAKRIRDVKIERDPIFIIGHWRSGTTLLHELLIRDERHGFANTYQCMEPCHFFFSSWAMTRFGKFLLPKKRPMDNMPAGWLLPQEDEFALCNLGVPTPYRMMAFPGNPVPHREYLDLQKLSRAEREQWKQAMLWFLKRVTYRDPRRVVLKSPPHTARIRTILEIFPDARFVHIVRNPFVLFPSTLRMWKSLNKYQGLQVSDDPYLEEFVLSAFEEMYAAFDRDRDLVRPERFYEVRYEDLVVDTLGEMERLYDTLHLGEFDRAKPLLADYLRDRKDYRTNRYELAPELREELGHRWGNYIERYGYETEAAA